MRPATNKIYERHWILWKAFRKSEFNEEDPFLTANTEDEKAALVRLMMLRRHQAGLRDKMATVFTAGIRLFHAKDMRSTLFLDLSVVAVARAACKMAPSELRVRREKALPSSVKLPVC